MVSSRPVLVLTRLSKRYDASPMLALDNVSLAVESGEVYGFLGANGAGKSTTIRTLLNFIQPTGGTAMIAGHDIVRESVAAKRFVGYLSGEVALYGKATGGQFLAYMAALQPLKHAPYQHELVKRFDLPLNQRIETLSKGNRQKLGLIQAFMHEPELLILDEPTSGLDPLMQEVFFALVSEAKVRGAAVFLSSHNLAEVQRICDRVGIIKHGRLIREQTIAELSDLQQPVFKITLSHAKDVALLRRSAELRIIQASDTTILVRPKTSISAALRAISRYNIASLTTEQLDLEDEFMKFYEDGQ